MKDLQIKGAKMIHYDWERITEIKQQLITLFGEIPDFFAGIKNGEEIEREGLAFGDLKNDTEIKADSALGAFIHEAWLKQLFEDCSIQIEGFADRGEELNFSRGDYWITADPLDGSLNYKLRGRSLGLPIATCMTLLKKQEKKTCFSDLLFGGVLDLRSSNDFWWAELTEKGEYQSYFNGLPAKTMDVEKLDIRSQIILADMYYPKNRELIHYGFLDDLGSIRSLGSAAYEMALVASGQVVAYFSKSQKQHELGAGYALVKGAGGVLVDLEGKDLGEREYVFNDWTPVIAAANQAIADQILERLHRV